MIRITSYLALTDWGRVVGVGCEPMPTMANFFEAGRQLRRCVALQSAYQYSFDRVNLFTRHYRVNSSLGSAFLILCCFTGLDSNDG